MIITTDYQEEEYFKKTCIESRATRMSANEIVALSQSIWNSKIVDHHVCKESDMPKLICTCTSKYVSCFR